MTEKKQNNILRNSIIIIITFVLGALVMWGVMHYFPITVSKVETNYKKDVTVNENGIADAVDKLYDAVVAVNTYANNRLYASGTGFVYKTEKGTAYILTNNHVINNGDAVSVKFTNGKSAECKIVGSDVYSDIAVLSVDEDEIISVAELGKSEDSRLGDTVFAIGTPIDSAFSWSVTRGIVSGKNRLVEVELSSGNTSTPMIVNTIQTDAAINNGNSGGPLANSNGEVIGITSIKLASSSIEGMGFAIPIENALDMASQLIAGKTIERPYLGIRMLDVADAYQSYEYYYLVRDANVESGVLVTSVEAKSSAALGGLEENDIIVKIDDEEVTSSAYLRYYLYRHKVGDDMKITVKRGDKEVKLTVRLTAS